jgi:DNA polymerase III subunit epsilon
VTAWWQGRLVGYDIESTSADPETARIVTAAIVAAGGSAATETLALLADPGVEISEGATAVHGVTTEQARAGGQPAPVVIALILDTLAAHLRGGAPLCIYQARFDLTILDREATRYRLVPLQERVALRVVDGLVLDKHLDRFRRGSRKLDAVCAHRGATLDDAHDAASDALAAARLAWCIGARGEVVRRVRNAEDGRELAALKREWADVKGDLDRLHAAQVRWAREQAEGLREYFAANGKTDEAASVSSAWPLMPFVGRAAA